MHYLTFGRPKNPAIVFLHGWGGSVDSWLVIAKRVAGLGFYSVVVDFKGFGKSGEPDTPYTIEDYAKDVENLVFGLSLNNVVLVGHSFGGRVAIFLASKNQNYISKVVLVDSAGVKPKRGLGYWIKVHKYKMLKKKVLCGKIDAESLNKYGSKDFKVLDDVMKATFINIVNFDLLPYAKLIKVPTLIVWGKKDEDTPLYMAKKLKRAIKYSKLIVYDAGHFSYLEYKNKFIDELYEFVVI